jgi:hypothetical protein
MSKRNEMIKKRTPVIGFISNKKLFARMGCQVDAHEETRHRNLVSQSYVTTDCQSASLSWNKAPIWGLRPIFITV